MFGKPAAEAPVKATKKAPPAAVGAVKKKAFGTSSAAPAKKAPSKIAPAGRKPSEDDGEDVEMGGIGTGWGGAKVMKAEYSDYANRLALKDGETVVGRFLDDAPYATVATHWFDKRKGRKSFQCWGKEKCELCAVGDKPRLTYNFNVAVLSDGAPVLHSWEVGVRVFDDLKKLAENPRYKPLSRLYYEISRSGTGMNDTKYTEKPYKRISDIKEEYPEYHVPDDDELAAMKRYTAADARKNRANLGDMQAMAEELTGGGYGDDDSDDDD